MPLAAARPADVDADPAPRVDRAVVREWAVAVLLAAAGLLISAGAALWAPAVGLVVAGVCLVLWTIAVFAVTA